MGQQTRRESYSGPISTICSRNDQHHHHHHHHHYYSQGQCRPLELVDKGDTLVSPLDKLEGLNQDDIRETAYEIFFMACRSSPGFNGRQSLSFNSNGGGDGGKPSQVVMSPTSKVKRALGLKMLKRSPSRRMVSGGSSGGTTPSSPGAGSGSPLHHIVMPARPRRPMTSAEIMRQQMKVTEHNDNRLRKTLMRTLVGQVRM